MVDLPIPVFPITYMCRLRSSNLIPKRRFSLRKFVCANNVTWFGLSSGPFCCGCINGDFEIGIIKNIQFKQTGDSVVLNRQLKWMILMFEMAFVMILMMEYFVHLKQCVMIVSMVLKVIFYELLLHPAVNLALNTTDMRAAAVAIVEVEPLLLQKKIPVAAVAEEGVVVEAA